MDISIEPRSRSINLDKLPQITFSVIRDSLNKNLSSLEETYRVHMNEFNQTKQNLEANQTDLNNLKESKPKLDREYIYYQELKAYLTDYLDCYSEKLDEIDKAEKNWLNLMKQRTNKFASRRQEDIRDQSYECSANKKQLDPIHVKRMLERQDRRFKHRLNLVGNSIESNEGFSTDEDESEQDKALLKSKREEILNELNSKIFIDILEDFYKYDLIRERFLKWKNLNYSSYKNTYVSLSLPKLFSPLIRIDLIDWNPVVEENNLEYLENSKWYKELLCFNKQNFDEDFMLVPFVIEKIVLNKLNLIIESVYEPLSTKQTNNLANFVLKLIKDFPTLNSQSLNCKKLVENLISRIKNTIDQDIFVPLYSKQLINDLSCEQSKFFNRQFWSCVKLFKNVLKWKNILSDNVLKELALDSLLNRYLMIGLQSMPGKISTIQKIEYIVKNLPNEWLQKNIESTGTMDLPQIANLIRLIRRIADQINEEEFKTNKIDSKEFGIQIQQIRKLFLSIGASDQALLLTSSYQL